MSKVGRNDPCPCGSGKKFKQCCLKKKKAGLKGMNVKVLSGDKEKKNAPPSILERTFGSAVSPSADDKFEKAPEDS